MSSAAAATEGRRIARNLGWQAISNIGVAGVGGSYLLYVGRVLGLENFGLYALLTAISTVAFACTDLRAHEAIVGFLSQWQTRIGEAGRSLRVLFLADCLSRLVVWGGVASCASLIAGWLLKSPDGTALVEFVLTGALLAKIGNNAATGVLRVFGRFDWQAKVLLTSWVVKLLATITVVSLGHKGVVPVLLVSFVCDIAANVLALCVAVYQLRQTPLWPVLLNERAPVTPEIRTFLTNGLGISLADSFIRELDTTIVGSTLTLEAVGLYRMAKNIVTLAWRALDPVNVVLMPEFANLAAVGNYARIRHIGARATVIVFILALVGLGGCVTILPLLVPPILGSQFLGMIPAVTIMMTGLVLGAPLIWNYALWVAAGRLGMQLRCNVLSAVVAGVLFVTLTPRFGLTGASSAFAVALALPFILSYALWQWCARRRSLG